MTTDEVLCETCKDSGKISKSLGANVRGMELLDCPDCQGENLRLKGHIEKNYKEFWLESVFDGKEPTLDQLKAELYDFYNLIQFSTQVYCHITGNRISKPMTLPEVVIAEADESYERLHSEMLLEQVDNAALLAEVRDRGLDTVLKLE